VRDAIAALRAGIAAVVRAPVLLTGVCLITIAAALPFGLVLGVQLRTALAHQPPIALESTEIDPEWWMHFRAGASGLARTFTPAVLGFAAPLDNASALLDAVARPPIMVVPIAAYGVTWAFLWGGILTRFASGQRLGVRKFIAASRRYFLSFTLIALGAASVSLGLYLTLHPLLFGPVFRSLADSVDSEGERFLGRVLLYVVFGAFLAAVSLTADYARIACVCGFVTSTRAAIAQAIVFIRRNLASVITLYLTTSALLATLFVLYGFADRRFGGWRGVLLGQAFVAGRLAIRLTFGASEVELFKRKTQASDQSTSRGVL
jgi:hypothetical protein